MEHSGAARRGDNFPWELLQALLSVGEKKAKVELNSLESRNVEYISEAGPVHIQEL